ncbi:hypothetical protein WJX73_008887 [Symbiochloris irregularis]|uniref:aminodeoxychorismate synthase n=1 Tax=Symbiochloris irregularis TaxID=706552 RepID=A0AAW1P0E8_9CHLO
MPKNLSPVQVQSKRAACGVPHSAPRRLSVAAFPTRRRHDTGRLGRTLLLDNNDSFTHNLFQLLAGLRCEAPLIIKNQDISWRQLRRLLKNGAFDNVVISPGPGSPEIAADVGLCLDLLTSELDIPILGVCLGMQCIAHAAGGKVALAPEPVHGRLSSIAHKQHALFDSIPSGVGYSAVRYHSLVVEEATLPCALEAIAWTAGPTAAVGTAFQQVQSGQDTPLLMGLAHRQLPYYGVQFHPESIATDHGCQLMQNFLQLASAHRGCGRAASTQCLDVPIPASAKTSASVTHVSRSLGLDVRWQRLSPERHGTVASEDIFCTLFASCSDAFWLDSSSAPDRGRFSFMGGRGGPLWRRITYSLPDPDGRMGASSGGTASIEDAQGSVESHELHGSFWDLLEQEVASCQCSPSACQDLPFDFWGGWVGYLGYELKAQTCGSNAFRSAQPDANLFFVDRLVAVDHGSGDVYMVALADTSSMRRSRVQYERDVASCLEELRAGNSYELCLTTAFERNVSPAVSPLHLYRNLRRINPAPHAAFLQFAGACPISICCSSPERFLHGSRSSPQGSIITARPIKGTAARCANLAEDVAAAAALAASEKDRSENLMIVDLLRNDLGQVCEVGTVQVPDLMQIESFATVHQMVSTVQGVRRSDKSVVDCIRAAFPGGSMTGAPKKRSMEILDRLEGAPRGIYSGSLGYISLNGAFDFNIVIRTAVISGGTMSIGAGGAVVMQSTAAAEFQEMQLKAERLLQAVKMSEAPAN